MRLSESLYSVKRAGENGMPLGELNQLVGLPGAEKSCLPHEIFKAEKPLSATGLSHLQSSRKELRSGGAVLSSDCIYIDSDISTEMKKKVNFGFVKQYCIPTKSQIAAIYSVDHALLFIACLESTRASSLASPRSVCLYLNLIYIIGPNNLRFWMKWFTDNT